MPPEAAVTAPPYVAPDLHALEAGLDSLQTAGPASPRRGRRLLRAAVPTTLFVLVAIAVWQLWVSIAHPRPDLFPGPADVVGALGAAATSGRLAEAIGTSLGRGGFGFALAVVIATPLGLLLAEVRWLRRAVGPILSGLQVLPSVAWVPAAILWFGLTDAAVYFVVLLGAVPSIVNGLLTGIDHVPPQLRRVGVVLGASRRQLQTRVLFPAALPGYVAGLRQGWAFAWRSLMAAEIIAGSLGFGLGSMLEQSRELADLPSVLATILTILVVGIVIELAVFAPVERSLLRRRGLMGTTR
ncbi:ABC transporter permease [Leifsonia sp. AG29]|uniref:ABC transporter permease n=1 Tax=Leifsonia sp. AG29 TaxID=2598860 RepID=UPI00131EA6AA|nr:ABC transporter permease [Leifsonia sp. AG29]